MSEQIKQMGGGVVKIGEKFEYFNLGNVTIQALAKNNIIPKKDYGDYNNKRPDGILVDRSNKKDPRVVAVIEYKSGEKFQKEKDIDEAVRQCNNYCQVLGALFGVATDTNISVWINSKQENKENEYTDEKGLIRSYSFIKDEEKQKLSNNFYFHLQKKDETNFEKLSDEVKETLKIIKRILDSDLGTNNSELKDTIFVDPTNLAKSVWQDIYVATGKEPEKCLYNVVEIFIFKFLSDLGVLQSIYSFNFLIEMVNTKDSDEDILKHYANTIRPKIKKELFPADIEDGTTIMNGTIFVNEKSEPVLEFASLFKKSIVRYYEFGDLTNVEKSFKTKLYETFLKRDSGVKGMGQFFTPRKVVGNMVEMAKVENLQNGARVCDPFCGVGGFPLEVIAKRNNKDFIVKNNEIKQNIEYFGFDKGSSEKDSERTIILAKANMLIYLSDLIKEYPKLTKEFSSIFNKTFKLKKGTLGTLADISDKEEEKFDLIITNPPYVTSGSAILKEEIAKDQDKLDFYKTNGIGLESLSLEWIINKLKKNGRAFIVLPDGIFNRLNDKKIRQFIIDECEINGMISLPLNTFFTTNKRTYILVITKKLNKNIKQIKPVFTYLVSDIGETLDVNRFDTGNSDLEKAKKLFRMFVGNEEYFSTDDNRCKIQAFSKFEEEVNNNWTVDRWWTKEEKIELGIEEQEEALNIEEFLEKLQEVKLKIDEMEKELLELIK
ncbi:N-6 DNA methylase [Candidatus Gracilibacteria bacterium]|nr:N-6 DNA methylase [Candidatus Gracilibacteria bacterium]